ncbi:MAG: hypothetical protein NVS1B3_10040 [Candidatus Dormibacteraceae bacterium]
MPMLIAMVLGSFTIAVLASDKVNAVRQGARLASEIGGAQTNAPPATTASVDQQIARNVLAVAQSLTYTTLTDICIYQASSPDRSYFESAPNAGEEPGSPPTCT